MFNNSLGFAVYVSTFEQQKPILEKLTGSNAYVFTSFHIQEEFNNSYTLKAKQMCSWLSKKGFAIMGDVSPKTLEQFGHDSILDFAQHMGLSALRLDYGFDKEEIIKAYDKFSIIINASVEDSSIVEVVSPKQEVFAMHNFYPRPETGLDSEQFDSINQGYKKKGGKVLAFIPGDDVKRGPLYEGLPTLEKHRYISPYEAYLDLAINYKIDGICVADVRLSNRQLELIQSYISKGVISIPTQLTLEHEYLYDTVFTIRLDSPKSVKRLQESREYSCSGKTVQPNNCIFRETGSITMDNKLYGRYSGEIQILKTDLSKDEKVNVIGVVDEKYKNILKCIKNGAKIKFIAG
ncbi:MupG family TIM beta-alpha barrel fold protein [Proteinivorax hydrogeniformans]|uniref:MupG family TIM beta-alpha barrel fold protein n=1 Tax=Proteinivorax hydrogeniformans TaxID=1826727 RepID=A0AAU8HTU7_9FIRM